MKKSLILLIVLLLCLPAAHAEIMIGGDLFSDDIEIGRKAGIDDVCAFTLKDISVHDLFLNVSSGESKQFLVASVDFINLMTEPVNVRTLTSAGLIYDEDFSFPLESIWFAPQGTYHRNADNGQLSIFCMNADGEFLGSTSASKIDNSLENPYFQWTNTYRYRPDIDAFTVDGDVDENKFYQCVDLDKFVFDPLVERSMYFVFRVPTLVTESDAEGLRELTLTIDGNDFCLTF